MLSSVLHKLLQSAPSQLPVGCELYRFCHRAGEGGVLAIPDTYSLQLTAVLMQYGQCIWFVVFLVFFFFGDAHQGGSLITWCGTGMLKISKKRKTFSCLNSHSHSWWTEMARRCVSCWKYETQICNAVLKMLHVTVFNWGITWIGKSSTGIKAAV